MKMPAGIRGGLLTACQLVVCASLMTSQPTRAESQTFSDLLAQAKAQAAEGHRWEPPGDNMTETVLAMMNLVPTATPEQVAELVTLLETDSTKPPQTAPVTEQPPDRQPVPEATAPAPSASPQQPPQAVATLPPASLEAPTRERVPDVVPNQAMSATNTRTAILFARGLDAENRGDFSAARRYYSSAAQQGNASAARSLGRLYDPAYLRHTALGGVDPDPALARQWYERAVQLGDTEVGPLLQALSAR
jgi:TPR repeat protein